MYIVAMGEYQFEWDPAKRARNRKSHGLDFEDAPSLFNERLMVVEDDREDYGEIRYVGLGELEDIVVVVVFTMRTANVIRIISLRPADNDEKEFYYGK